MLMPNIICLPPVERCCGATRIQAANSRPLRAVEGIQVSRGRRCTSLKADPPQIPLSGIRPVAHGPVQRRRRWARTSILRRSEPPMIRNLTAVHQFRRIPQYRREPVILRIAALPFQPRGRQTALVSASTITVCAEPTRRHVASAGTRARSTRTHPQSCLQRTSHQCPRSASSRSNHSAPSAYSRPTSSTSSNSRSSRYSTDFGSLAIWLRSTIDSEQRKWREPVSMPVNTPTRRAAHARARRWSC